MYEKQLEEFGLSEKEAKVYISSLELGQDTIINIAKKSRINRTTIYPIIDALVKMGLMSEVQKKRKKYYFAESPIKIKTYLESKIATLVNNRSRLDELISTLGAIENKRSDKPIVRFFEGNDG